MYAPVLKCRREITILVGVYDLGPNIDCLLGNGTFAAHHELQDIVQRQPDTIERQIATQNALNGNVIGGHKSSTLYDSGCQSAGSEFNFGRQRAGHRPNTGNGARPDPSGQGGRTDLTTDESTKVTRSDRTQNPTHGIELEPRRDLGGQINVESLDVIETVQMTDGRRDTQDKTSDVGSRRDPSESTNVAGHGVMETVPINNGQCDTRDDKTRSATNTTDGRGCDLASEETRNAETELGDGHVGQLRRRREETQMFVESDTVAINKATNGGQREASCAEFGGVDGQVNALEADGERPDAGHANTDNAGERAQNLDALAAGATSGGGNGVDPTDDFQAAGGTCAERRVAAVSTRSQAGGRQTGVGAGTAAERPFTTVRKRSKGDIRSTDESGGILAPDDDREGDDMVTVTDSATSVENQNIDNVFLRILVE